MKDNKIDSTSDFTSRGLGELKAWLEPWWQQRGGGGAITWEDVGLTCGEAASGVTFSEGVLSTSDLISYWRLGESVTPWVDSAGSFDLVIASAGGSVALTPHVTGALVSDDDGAVELNLDSTTSVGEYLNYGSSTVTFRDLSQMTVCAWVKVKNSAFTRYGAVVGTLSSTGVSVGWGLVVHYPDRVISFTRSGVGGAGLTESSGGLTAGQWYFVVGSNDGATNKLYIDGVLVDSAASAGTASAGVADILIGLGGWSGSGTWIPFYGSVDEVAVWSRALTDDEITMLYTAGTT